MDKTLFTFPENVTLEFLPELLDNLKTFDLNNDISLDFSRIKYVDISFLQMICSLHKTIFKNNKKLHKTNNLPDSVEKIIEDIYFNSTIENCSLKDNCPFRKL
jgi:anti-anti-sigma regulatory factor